MENNYDHDSIIRG